MRSSNLMRQMRSSALNLSAKPSAARRKSSMLVATEDEASTMSTASTGTSLSVRSFTGCSRLSSKTRKSLRVRSFTNRPFESRTVTGSRTSLVTTEITSPGLTSWSGGRFKVGTAGGAPRESSAEGVGVGLAFGRAEGLGFCFFWALEMNPDSPKQKDSKKKAAIVTSSTVLAECDLCLLTEPMDTLCQFSFSAANRVCTPTVVNCEKPPDSKKVLPLLCLLRAISPQRHRD